MLQSLSTANIVFASINLIVLTFGVSGNAILIGYYLLRRKKLHVIDIEILNLVFSDLGYLIFRGKKQQNIKSSTLHSFKTTITSDNAKTSIDIRSTTMANTPIA
ncbi:hypothetical protein TrispH2_009984 [Trichoplax sp. H2]|nr:hypothetical protein TrispH2_009984 [Trichoplax sp. H2]|eukprot:RDD39010.1 hypothetical protein TrispH2_009984 [Trichoplax sp. H2]